MKSDGRKSVMVLDNGPAHSYVELENVEFAPLQNAANGSQNAATSKCSHLPHFKTVSFVISNYITVACLLIDDKPPVIRILNGTYQTIFLLPRVRAHW